MQFSIKLLESNSQISNSILQALMPEVDNYLKKALIIIRKDLPSLIKNIIFNGRSATI